MSLVISAVWVFPTFVIGLFVTAIIHELAHIAVGSLLGIPIASFYLFDSRTLAPTIWWDVHQDSWQLTVTSYAGGLVAGTIAGLAYWGLRQRQAKKIGWWWATAVIAGFTLHQLSQGLMEGAVHDAYMRGAGGGGAWTTYIQLVAFFLGFGLHVWSTKRWWRGRL